MAKGRHTIYIEMRSTPAGLHVFAIDPSDALEVTFIAPKTASEEEIKRLAVDKLTYVRSKEQAGGDEPPTGSRRRGTLA